MEKVESLMDIRLWPYGKAETHDTESGVRKWRMLHHNHDTAGPLFRPDIRLPARPSGVRGEHLPRLRRGPHQRPSPGRGDGRLHDQRQHGPRGGRRHVRHQTKVGAEAAWWSQTVLHLYYAIKLNLLQCWKYRADPSLCLHRRGPQASQESGGEDQRPESFCVLHTYHRDRWRPAQPEGHS